MASSYLVALTLVIAINGGSIYAAKLGTYRVDSSKISVSGLSAGGFMAVQMHVAYSGIFAGVGVLAGGPYYCAKGTLTIATTSCMATPSMINVASLQEKTDEVLQDSSLADPLEYMQNDRVYLYSGTKDSVVAPEVVKKTEEYYLKYVSSANIKSKYDIPGQHGFPTEIYGGVCGILNTDYINKCDYDAAYDMLEHIHGPGLQEPSYSRRRTSSQSFSTLSECQAACDQCLTSQQSTSSPSSSSSTTSNPDSGSGGSSAGTILSFDQTEFFDGWSSSEIGLDDQGYLYVPDKCADQTANCGLHLELHGCKQGEEFIGTTYVKQTGLNEVAMLNNFIVMYPQTKKNSMRGNPNGCFDWWGYTDKNYAYKTGLQMTAIRKMVERVANV